MHTVFIDVDGVLLDWLGAFLDWAYENDVTHDKNGDPIRVKPEWVNEYNLREALAHWIHPDAVIPALHRFEGSTYWHDMRPLADIRLLEAVKNAGVRLHILSVCSPAYRVDSLLRLSRHYGPVFDGCEFCKTLEKARFIEHICNDKLDVEDSAWFIEDFPQNLLSHDVYCVNNMLVTQPYNLAGPGADAFDRVFPEHRYASVNDALLHILKEVLNAE